MHSSLPVFCIIQNETDKTIEFDMEELLDKDDVYDTLEQNFDADYFKFLDVPLSTFQKLPWASKEFDKFATNKPGIYEFKEEKLIECRKQILNKMQAKIDEMHTKEENFASSNWGMFKFYMKHPEYLSGTEVLLVYPDGTISQACYLSDIDLFEGAMLVKYVGMIDYHI